MLKIRITTIMSKEAKLELDGKVFTLPTVEGSEGEKAVDVSSLRATTGYITLDDGYVQAVLRVFVSLYEKGYIYRDRYMVNWDPGSGSAISDLEVEPREETDTLYYIDYPLASGDGKLTVATVRPETLLARTK